LSKKEPSYPLKALDKSLAILEILSQENSPLSIAELSERLGIYPSTIHRILDTLRYWGYVEQDLDTQRYQLGLKVLELGMTKHQGMELVKEVAPIKDHRGKVIAAISASLPAFRKNASKKRKLKEILIQTCEIISTRLGYNKTRRTTSVC
jgi:DNA-binding IclR family transcriptional regulator